MIEPRRIALGAALAFASITPVYGSEPDRTVRCGGFPFGRYEIPFVWMKTVGQPLRVESVMAVAAVTETAGDNRAKAWLMWDDHAKTWLVTTDTSPEDLKVFRTKLPTFPTQLPRSTAKITYIERPDPWIFSDKYRLSDCPYVAAAPEQ